MDRDGLGRGRSTVTVAANYRRLAVDLERVSPKAVEEATKIVRAALNRSGRQATGDGRFSGAPWARLTIDADVRRLTAGDATAEITPARRAGGPWRWIEDGTTRHPIGRGHDRSGRNRRRLRLGDGWIAGPVVHPGATGKQAWSRAIDESADRALDAMRREYGRVL